MNIFEIKNVAFQIFGHPISYIEFIGTLFGFASVYYASRENSLTWGTGIVNEIFLFILFFQVQLYADMFLQIYFFAVTIYGWYNWNAKTLEKKSITETNVKKKIFLAIIIIIGTLISGVLFTNVHLYLPQYFKVKAAYPFADSFIMVSSFVATILLAKKKIENWYLWLLVDSICIVIYFKKGVYFLSIEYFIFLILATYGLYNWKKQVNYD